MSYKNYLSKIKDYSVSTYLASLWVSDSKQKYCNTVTLKKLTVSTSKLFHHKHLHSNTKKKVEAGLLALHHTKPKLITLMINVGLDLRGM